MADDRPAVRLVHHAAGRCRRPQVRPVGLHGDSAGDHRLARGVIGQHVPGGDGGELRHDLNGDLVSGAGELPGHRPARRDQRGAPGRGRGAEQGQVHACRVQRRDLPDEHERLPGGQVGQGGHDTRHAFRIDPVWMIVAVADDVFCAHDRTRLPLVPAVTTVPTMRKPRMFPAPLVPSASAVPPLA